MISIMFTAGDGSAPAELTAALVELAARFTPVGEMFMVHDTSAPFETGIYYAAERAS